MFYGHYRSSTTSETGCVKEFLTLPHARPLFPAQVQWFCELCNGTHGFRLTATHQAATPRQQRQLGQYCREHGIETDIDWR